MFMSLGRARGPGPRDSYSVHWCLMWDSSGWISSMYARTSGDVGYADSVTASSRSRQLPKVQVPSRSVHAKNCPMVNALESIAASISGWRNVESTGSGYFNRNLHATAIRYEAAYSGPNEFDTPGNAQRIQFGQREIGCRSMPWTIPRRSCCW